MIVGGVDTAKQVMVVAEIGNNHEGSLEVVRQLVRRAADAGVNAVKFQTFKAEHFVGTADPARYRRLKSFELSYAAFEALADLARSGSSPCSAPMPAASA